MSKLGALLVVLFLIGITSDPAAAQSVQPHRNSRPDTEIRLSGGTLRHVEISPAQGVHLWLGERSTAPTIIERPEAATSESVTSAASTFATSLLPSLGLSTSATLQGSEAFQVSNVWQSSYRLAYDGIPVRDRALEIVTGAISGKVMSVRSELPEAAPNASIPALAPGEIESKLSQLLGSDGNNPYRESAQPALVYVSSRRGDKLTLCYEVFVDQLADAHLWRLTVDATTGALIEKKEMLEFLGGDHNNAPEPLLQTLTGRIVAKVHPHSSFDSLATVGLPYTYLTINGRKTQTDIDGYWTLPAVAPPYAISTEFRSTFSHTIRSDGVNSVLVNVPLSDPYVIEWDSSNSNAGERDAFYYSDFAHAYVRTLDRAIAHLDDSLAVNVNLSQTCNAFYNPQNVSLNFFNAGNGCTNTGEISDVVYHEFGHRVVHSRYQVSKNGYIVNTALNEGFADLVSAFIRDDSRIGIGFFSGDKKKVLRNCDNTMQFPRDLSGDPHVTGEIISGAIWDLRKLIGHDTAEKLFHNAMWLAPDAPADDITPSVMKPAFISTLIDMLMVDDNDNDLLNGTPHSDAILASFRKHNITLAELINLGAVWIQDQDTMQTSYAVPISAKYSGPIGELNQASVTLSYSTDNGKTYAPVVPSRLNDSQFVARIPRVAPGSIVNYYVSAETTVPNGGTLYVPSISAPYFFTVGYHPSFSDDCETDKGWMTGMPTDRAVTGRWVRDIPHGTFVDTGYYVQQDTDHTPNGSMCFVTGNMNTTTIGADDVDSGTTTLTTPLLDLSKTHAPVIRYWYYYSNDQGSAAGTPIWQTQVSSDAGATWKTVQFTNVSTDGWAPYLFRVSDYCTPTSRMVVRFLASDNVGAIVEAGVDDFEVLTAPESQDLQSVSEEKPSTTAITGVFPNPGVAGSAISVRYANHVESHVTIAVKDVNGDLVATPVDQQLAPGTYTSLLKPASQHLAPGVYWIVLTTERTRSIRKLVVE